MQELMELLLVEEAARVLRIGRSTAYAMAQRGELPAIRIGQAVRIPRRALQQWLAAKVEASRCCD